MSTLLHSTRRAAILAGIAVSFAAPLSAQTTTTPAPGTAPAVTATGTDAATNAAATQPNTTPLGTSSDTVRTEREDHDGFPWGLLGLLGLAGLLRRPARETVLRDATYRDATAGRPGDRV